MSTIIKCKMCGGDLVLNEGSTIATCEYCGSQQTVPTADSEKKLTLFARANRLRMGCEFDKAASVYEAIVADFPEEAEAYWGLVLCKYGIEYVDDPATGNKIPTCHRSSFESIMDDSDLEQVLENADILARKQYRDEAKQIEEIRKGIIAVSANERPYDIFICYKETDANGDRTLDSVLAQDIYDALTAKNYRVFFSRITLEDKLGMEYEPYIFAALNSAKIMLAVGTDYEYYNAVWVKNEWSRYLKLMAKDKDKHLIPCFKGIDAYDMPKEFARLQAQDLGKVGAMQDLLRGIEKILSKNQPVTVVQEKVVVGGSANNKIASLLDRGNMALEDGDWAKADSFFEDVLNNDSKNAQAYLGKTLVQEKCRTIDAFVRKRKEVYQTAKNATLHLEPNKAHIEEMVSQYSLIGYLGADDIRRMYDYDLSYASATDERKAQYRLEEAYWANHKLLSRAEKFAEGAVAENLAREKKSLFATLSERIKQAEAAEKPEREALAKRYADFLTQTDAKAEERYRKALALREENYDHWLKKAKEENSPRILKELEQKFTDLRDFRDSKSLAEYCHKRAEEEQARIDAAKEAERIRLAKQRAVKKRNTLIVMACIALVAMIAFGVFCIMVLLPQNNYQDALTLMEAGQYDDAIAIFEKMGDYEDSRTQISECRYRAAVQMITDGRYEEAVAAFEMLGDYKDSATRIKEAKAKINTNEMEKRYLSAIELKEDGQYEEAMAMFKQLPGYKDSAEQVELCQSFIQAAINEQEYQKAIEKLNAGEYQEAALALGKLGDFKDARTQSLTAWSHIRKPETLSRDFYYSVGLKNDGTLVTTGWNSEGQLNVGTWNDIVSISTGGYLTVGLKSNGRVVAAGSDECGQSNVGNWRNIVAVASGTCHTLGLKADGTVVAVGSNDDGQCNVTGWTDIVAIGAGNSTSVGLKSDGTIVATGYSYGNRHGEWQRIDLQSLVSGWTDIVAISVDSYFGVVGLKTDGTVLVAGDDDFASYDVADWSDIVAISAGSEFIVGLKSNGTVVATGKNDDGQCNVTGWTDIVAISAGGCHTLGLKANGTVVAVGLNSHGECNVSRWKNIKIP